MNIRRKISYVFEDITDFFHRIDFTRIKAFTIKCITNKKFKMTAAAVLGMALIVGTVTISRGFGDTGTKETAALYKTAGVMKDIMKADGVIDIDPAELAVITQTDAYLTAAAEQAAAQTANPAPAAAPAAEAHSVSGYTNLGVANVDSYLNIRETPSEGGKLCGKLPQNSGCEILDENDGWFHISSGKVTGYVKKEYLMTGDAAWAKAEEIKTMTATVNTQTLYVREQPSTECKIVTMVPAEEELEVMEEQAEWIKVKVDNDEGYISKAYVSIGYKLPKAVELTKLETSAGVSQKNVSIVEYAKQFLGNRYVWGGSSLTKGTDCSGFTMSIYSKFGVSLPHSSSAQSKMGTKVSPSEAKPGDLFFYGSGSRVNHVAMYIGGGRVIHASTERTGIKISNASYRTPVTVRRFLK